MTGVVMRAFIHRIFDWPWIHRDKAMLEQAKLTNQRLKAINDTLKRIAEKEEDPLAALMKEEGKGVGGRDDDIH